MLTVSPEASGVDNRNRNKTKNRGRYRGRYLVLEFFLILFWFIRPNYSGCLGCRLKAISFCALKIGKVET